MKNSKSLIAALVMATASIGTSTALAADISNGPFGLAILDHSAFFGDSFAINNEGNTFMDQFRFTVSDMPHDLDAIAASISSTADTGLDITGLDVYSGAGSLISAGTMSETGIQDVWTLSARSLPVGNYYMQVSGTMVSNTSGSFGGSVMLTPVPEPETYGMMLAGLGVLGFLARRRKAANQA